MLFDFMTIASYLVEIKYISTVFDKYQSSILVKTDFSIECGGLRLKRKGEIK